MLSLLGLPHLRTQGRRLPDQAAGALHTLYGWTPTEVMRFLEGLPPATAMMLRRVIAMPNGIPTSMLATELGLPDPKPIGSMLASIRRRAEVLGVANPVVSHAGEEARTVALDQKFREAGQQLLLERRESP